MKPTMIVLAGPNGAIKSTLYATRIAPGFVGPFFNADFIRRDELRDPSPEASHEAARIPVARVEARVEEGRHNVPEDKIRARYAHGAPFIREAVHRADRGMVFDNSGLNMPQSSVPDICEGPIGVRAAVSADLGHINLWHRPDDIGRLLQGLVTEASAIILGSPDKPSGNAVPQQGAIRNDAPIRLHLPASDSGQI
jgi:predicted ABC-type ATPase